MTDYLPKVADVPFPLGRPEDLPVLNSPVEDAVAVRELLGPPPSTIPGYLDSIRAARASLRAVDTTPVGEDPVESEANRDNDIAFGIVRTQGHPVPLLIRAALAAQTGLLDLADVSGVNVSPEDWAELLAGVEYLIDWLTAPGSVPDIRTVPAAREIDDFRPNDALRRWVRGHHVFMVLCQAMVLGLRRLQACIDADDVDGARVAAVCVDQFMRSSRAAFKFAGDVRPEDYRAEIRATLMPPIAPPKMSGLHWRDHEALIAGLKRSRKAWTWLSERQPECVTNLQDTLSSTYDAHRGVCEHFVGKSAPSLLATQRSTRSASSVLKQLREVRMDLLT